MKADIYNVQNRLENVNRRIKSSQSITLRNKELIRKFCDHCRLQGLLNLSVVFYLNRFWNIARLATRNFDEMTKEDVQRLMIALRELKKRNGEPVSERTVVDHVVAIKTFWKWLKGAENEFPPCRRTSEREECHRIKRPNHHHDLPMFGLQGGRILT